MALALTLRGIDNWTRQFFDEAWVELGHAGLMGEIQSSTDTVILSSERLAAMGKDEIEALKALFFDFEIHVIMVRRDVQCYLSSTWRHAVYRHDFAESYEDFLKRFDNFSFDDAKSRFGEHFEVHDFNMDAPDYATALGTLLGTTIDIPSANVGVPMEFAQLLQRTHVLLGSEEFEKCFNASIKKSMLDVWSGRTNAKIKPMTAPLF